MLDFTKLSPKISNISLELARESELSNQRLLRALEIWQEAELHDQELSERVALYIDKFPWMIARPIEFLNQIKALPENTPEKFTVVATDGSQISPSHHEIALCYLINVGLIMYTYGTGEPPLQTSEPFIYDSEKDFYTSDPKKTPALHSEEVISIKRMLAETGELVKLCRQAKERGHPAIAMVDGTLITWSITNQMWSQEFQEQILEKFLSFLDEIKEIGVPVCGYISNSRRNDVVNLLRVQICPHKEIDCENLCAKKEDCDEIVPLYDRNIWQNLLKEGERSPIFASTAKIIEKYKDHQVCFFYLNVGRGEIARIEIPRWVVDNEDHLQLIHFMAYDQVQKGLGYPISIQEAHNRAVIRGSDRAQFYSMLSRKMIDGQMTVALSNKELRKRGGIA